MKLFVVAAILAVAAADRPAPRSYSAPAQPSYSAPAQRSYSAPAQPSYSAPAQPSYSAPAQPSYSAPAAPKYGQKVPQILSQEFDLRDDQSYDASYETENGISASESGRPVAGYGDEQSYDVQGQYSYTGDDGVTYTVTYVADANGFQPQGDHLPTPVPTEYPTPEVSVTQASYQAAPAPRYQPAPAPRYQPAPAPAQPQYQQYQPRYQ